MDREETDRRLRDLYAENAAPVDMEEFSASLHERLARTRRRRRWMPEPAWSSRAGTDEETGRTRVSSPKRPTRLRVAVYASIAVVLVVAFAVGSLQAFRHLGNNQPILVITDDSLGISPGSTGQTDQTAPSVSATGGTTTTTGASTTTTASPAEVATLVWKFQAGGSVYEPTVSQGVIYVGSGDGHLYAVDAADGSEICKFQADGQITASPAVSDGVAYVGSGDGHLYAVDIQDGTEIWKFQTGASITGGSPAVSDGMVYIGNSDGLLCAVDIEDGTEIWKFQADGQITASPVVSDGVVFVGSWGMMDQVLADGRFYAVDAQSGAEVWNYRPVNSVVASATLLDGAVLFADYSGVLYALDTETGAENWQVWVCVSRSMPVISNEMIYLTDELGWLHALDAGGESVWRFQTSHSVRASPAVLDGVVYIGNEGGTVFAVDAQTGTEKWGFETGDVVRSTPAVSDGVVYVGSDDGYLYALR